MNLSILLQATEAAGEVAKKGFFENNSLIFMMVALFAVMYFFMIRPQQKRQKEIKKFQESIGNGTEVVTAGGIYGKVREVKERQLIVEIAENVRIKIDKNSVYASAAQEQPAK